MYAKPLTFLLALTFLFLFSGSVYCQEEVKREYWDNGKLKGEIYIKNGKPDGMFTQWYESGKKKSKSHWKNGELEGLATDWFESGNKESESYRKNGKTEGMFTTWFESGGKSLKETPVRSRQGKGMGVV